MKDFQELVKLAAMREAEIQTDSRKVKAGDIFVAITGEADDGLKYVPQAIQNGASHIVCKRNSQIENLCAGTRCEAVFCEDPRQAVWELARSRYRTDAAQCRIIGITGTNGKTTSAYLLEHLLTSLGYKTGVLGTVNYRWPGVIIPAPLTTPGPLDLHKMIRSMDDAGTDFVIMEVSSHALVQQRVNGLEFCGALFTNLTQDHLDFHLDMESYFRAKAKLFLDIPSLTKIAAINGDDEYGRRLLELLPQAISFGLHWSVEPERHLKGAILSAGRDGTQLEMEYQGNKWKLFSPLVGKFNAMNLLGVQALALGLGFAPSQLESLAEFHGVCGRLERIKNKSGHNIFVDYAHTPDALEKAILALRNSGFKRIITVFGCGGNRDKTKRPLMGATVGKYSDIAIVTSDNPRNEDKEAIIKDILTGMDDDGRIIVEVDRREATKAGIAMLQPDDALLIAGKGHEDYQIIQGVKHHYSDQETVRELLCS